jgi:phage terminase small subunit
MMANTEVVVALAQPWGKALIHLMSIHCGYERGKQLSAKVSQEEKSKQLSPKQEKFLLLLVSGISIVAAAQHCAIAEKTAHQWLNTPSVQQAYRAAQRKLFDEELSVLMKDIEIAINGIKAIAKDSEVPANVRLRAYQVWLEQAINIHKVSELESQVKELQELIKGRNV